MLPNLLLPIRRALWRLLALFRAGDRTEACDWFLSGYSIQKTGALLLPGIGGPAMVDAQFTAQEEIRDYCLALEAEVFDLRGRVAELELRDLLAQPAPATS